MVVMGFWAWWCIRETKGIPIEEMDKLFGAEHSAALDDLKVHDSERHSGEISEKTDARVQYIEQK